MYKDFAELLLSAFDIELIADDEIASMIKELTPEERRALRRVIERLDAILDGLIIEERLERIRERIRKDHSDNTE